MTKEELIKHIDQFSGMGNISVNTIKKLLNELFESKVCIPKGENRHKYADVLHEWAEGAEIEMMFPNGTQVWSRATYLDSDCEYRIKPSEPVYEWQWLVREFDDTNIYVVSQGCYYTDAEIGNWNYKKKIEATKRIRK